MCSSAAIIPQSKSTEMWSLAAAAIPQSKSTETWSSTAPFHHDLWYFWHWTNEHFSSVLFIRKNVTSPQWPHSSHWNQYTPPNYWKSYWREPHTHSTKGFDDSLETCETERCSVKEPVFKHNHRALASTTKMWSWVVP